MPPDPLARFTAPTRNWFRSTFEAPTKAQAETWEAAAGGHGVLVSAPTGSGKTLAAFLAAIDRLTSSSTSAPPGESGHSDPSGGVNVLYVSPQKALAYDIDRNLRAPLAGIRHQAGLAGLTLPDVDVGLRTGDTPQSERARLSRDPPHILITTPESLFLLLTSAARRTLASVETVIVDEVHAVAGSKRGAHLALSLERLESLVASDPQAPSTGLQRIGLSATQRPLEELASFLGGGRLDAEGTWTPRPVRIVEERPARQVDVEIVVPVEDMSRLGEVEDELPSGPTAGAGQTRRSIWPAVHPRILELIRAHRTTIVFANSRRLTERLCERLNELAAAEATAETAAEEAGLSGEGDGVIARAHHGSVAREQRAIIEDDLKAGRLRCVVATSSLELGIDMGSVDLVVQVESPGSVATGLQRIGRAGHHVGEPSAGKIFPKYRGDLLEAAVVADRMTRGEIEETHYPRNALDVCAQQVVAMTAMDDWSVDGLHGVIRQAAGFAELSRQALDGVLDMLSGRYPSDEFAELRPRVNWDRVADRVSARSGAQRLAVTSGGAIPDRGLYGVYLASEEHSRRVGELDEEMVYETRPGETFMLGSTTWRVSDITRDRVLVEPAPGEPGKMPFWHGDSPGRPIEVGRAVGAFVRTQGEAVAADPDTARLPEAAGGVADAAGLDEWASANLAGYLREQQEATGTLPSDRAIVIERFRDEIGDWRIVVHSPFGGRVHAPWALAIEAKARERLGFEVQTIYADDGIVVCIPESDEVLPGEAMLVDPDEAESLVVGELANSALFASRFRECAARALLLPRRRPQGRTPLWQQRQKAADLLSVASRYGSFPVLLEAYRECLSDVFDLPALVEVLGDVANRRIRVVQADTESPSPFASALLFEYVGSYLYEGDAPLAERRAHALSLDRELLAELLGSEELRELIDPDALGEVEAELQRLPPERHARSADGVADLLRELGDLRTDEVAARTDGDAPAWLDQLARARRAYQLWVAGEQRWVAAEDAARFRDGLGLPPAPGLPSAFLEPVDRPLVDLVSRFARTHGPFHTGEVAARLGLPHDAVELACKQLSDERRLLAGEFRPSGASREWCDADVLRRLRRRSLARLRAEVEPVEPAALARFLPAWQRVGGRVPGVDATAEVIEQLQGAAVPASALEPDVLGTRVAHYTPAWLDELCASGEVVWVGQGPLGSNDGRIAVYLRDQAPLLAPAPDHALVAGEEWSDRHRCLLSHLETEGASFWPQLYEAAGGGDEKVLVAALWDLAWAGLVVADTFAPVRAAVGGGQPRTRTGRRRRPRRVTSRAGPPAAAGRWSLAAELVADRPADTERATALASQLLDRYGVLTRDAVVADGVAGGFSAIYPVLKTMEEHGRARRGYFVEGLGGAQFALPGAVDRLRAVREAGLEAEASEPVALAATDPANPFGAALAWPDPPAGGRARRTAGAFVVLAEGRLVAYLERGARSLVCFADDAETLRAAASGLVALVDSGRLGRIQLQRIDGEAVADQPVIAALREAGFADSPRGLTYRGKPAGDGDSEVRTGSRDGPPYARAG